MEPQAVQEPKALRADARRNRERLLAAALDAFAECGEHAQMDDIARRAEVGVGTLYRHFPTRDALLGELMAAKFRYLTGRAEERLAVEDPWEAFAGFIRERVAEAREDATQQRVMWSAQTTAALDFAAPERERLSAMFGQVIERAQRAGVLRRDFAPADMPSLMCALGAAAGGPAPAQANVERLVEFVLDGLRAKD